MANNSGKLPTRDVPNIWIHSLFHFPNKYNISYLHVSSQEDILMKLKTYHKFVVVRHPLDRLVSAYKDKLAGDNEVFEHLLGTLIIKALRPNASDIALKSGKGVTFQEYIKYLTTVHMTEQHWENYQDHCHPCIIDYDYIAKLETQEMDGKYIINEHLSGFGADNLVNKHSNRGGATLSKHLPEFENITSELLHELASVYARDFDMFGYSYQEQDKHILAKCGANDTAECC